MILGASDHRALEPAEKRSKESASQISDGAVLTVRDLFADHLEKIDFDVARGEIVGVVGIDGSGREDLARALVGAIHAVGTVTCGGRRVALKPKNAAAAGIALVLGTTETGSSISEFTVRENFSLAALPACSSWGRVDRRQERDLTRTWIDLLDVRPREPETPFQALSGGNKQKVLIGKWLASGSEVFVIDEPTAGVDVGARRAIYDLIEEQAALGKAFVLCSSDLEDVTSVCQRALVMQGGRIVAELTGGAITQQNLLPAMSGALMKEATAVGASSEVGQMGGRS
jgi:ribose transport system ATP-binding protein